MDSWLCSCDFYGFRHVDWFVQLTFRSDHFPHSSFQTMRMVCTKFSIVLLHPWFHYFSPFFAENKCHLSCNSKEMCIEIEDTSRQTNVIICWKNCTHSFWRSLMRVSFLWISCRDVCNNAWKFFSISFNSFANCAFCCFVLVNCSRNSAQLSHWKWINNRINHRQ